jgi:hypothetical protein
MKKVALLGGVKSTLMLAPYADPSWAIWSHCSVPLSSAKRVDRWFDLHPPLCFTMEIKNGRRYYEWLKGLTTPVYMQKHNQEIPASVKYPRERIQAEWPGIPFGSQTAWMIALALAEGYDTIGLFGIHYQHDTEYFEQRANAELWVGIAYGRGAKVVIPEGCPLAKEPVARYGYDTHSVEDFARRREAMKRAKDRDAAARAKAPGAKVFDPARLRPIEEREPDMVGV